jgi:hypothetical protein
VDALSAVIAAAPVCHRCVESDPHRACEAELARRSRNARKDPIAQSIALPSNATKNRPRGAGSPRAATLAEHVVDPQDGPPLVAEGLG